MSVYIVVILVSCHTIRIIPNVWEIAQTITAGPGPKVNIIDPVKALTERFDLYALKILILKRPF